MGIEATVNGIKDLDPTLPLGGDQKNKGDDHLRNIKTALVNDFAEITGAVTASHTELNYLDGSTPGTVVASKALVVDASKNLGTLGSVTATAFNGLLTGNVTGNVTGNIVGVVNTGSSIASAVTATTQSAGDNSTKVATTAYVDQLFGTKTFTSNAYTASMGTAVNLNSQNHGLGGTPDILQLYAKCTTADSPYSVGDVVVIPYYDDSGTMRGGQVFGTATQVGGRTADGGVRFFNKSNGTAFNPTNGSWSLYIKAIKF